MDQNTNYNANQLKAELKSSASLLNYPISPEDRISEDYFGTIVPDPYRWLEDDLSEKTADWVRRQNEFTTAYLDQIPFRNHIRQRLKELMNYEKMGTPYKEKKHYYFFKNAGLQNQEALFRCQDFNEDAEMILDPNQFSEDGTISISTISVSPDEKYLAFQISDGGSDWNEIAILDLESRTLLPEKLKWIKFSGIAWTENGFYYSRYPEPDQPSELSGKNQHHAVYFHIPNRSQDQDTLVYQDLLNPQRNVYAQVSEDLQYLYLSISESTSGNALAMRKLNADSKDWVWLVDELTDDYHVVGNSEDRIYILTNHEASRWCCYELNLRIEHTVLWKPVIPEFDEVLQSVKLLNQKLVATYMQNACSKVRIFDLDGNDLYDLALPEMGTIGDFSGKSDHFEAFYSFSSFKRPSTIYKINLDDYTSEVHFSPSCHFNSEAYITEQVWYKSKDGTEIPMFLTYHKNLDKNGSAPTLLYGYGGFDVSITPEFNINRIPILESGGILAVANLRGGGEFGRAWHLSGTRERKQNVFDDFKSASDFLVREKYTSRERLAIEGRSNGGLLIGACITQFPDMCRVAFPMVGVLDMLRYHKFTIGWAWITDYGSSNIPEEFDYLYNYSPVHRCDRAGYPSTLIMTADHDDRVVPAHSFKFAAALQKAQTALHPILIRIDISAGHGAGKPTSKRLEENTDLLSFMFFEMNLEPVFRKIDL